MRFSKYDLKCFCSTRMADSAWFTWVSQCNHIVMDVHDDDPQDTWLNLQVNEALTIRPFLTKWPNSKIFSKKLKATCNITKSAFNDWFTGHLNFQIEHQ